MEKKQVYFIINGTETTVEVDASDIALNAALTALGQVGANGRSIANRAKNIKFKVLLMTEIMKNSDESPCRIWKCKNELRILWRYGRLVTRGKKR